MKRLIIIIMLVLLSVSVIAPGTVITNVGVLGYQIETTPYDYMILGQNFTANFHVYNLSDGSPLNNNSINCELHIYDHYGSHIFKDDSLSYILGDGEWEVFIPSNNFSVLGTYAWVVFCNSSSYGGFRSSIFEITPDGYDNTPDTSPSLAVLFFMLFIIIGLFILGFVGKFNRFEIVNLCIRRGCFVVGIMLMMYTSTLLLNITSYANLDILSGEMVFLMTWIGWAGYMASAYLVIKTLFDIIDLRKKQKEAKVYEGSL